LSLTTYKTYNNIKPHIMKKVFYTFGLLSLVMILTSFTKPETNKVTVNKNTTLEAVGSGAAGGTVRLDAVGSGAAGGTVRLDAVGSGAAGGTVRLDAVGSGAAGGTVRLD
jgi:hypothetical protein